MYLWWLGLSTQSYLFPTKGVTLFMSHFFEQNFDIYIVVVVWSVNWTIPVFHKQKGHTFYVALFWAKFLLEHSYESQFSLSTESHLSSPIWGHTFHDTLFWAKFLFIYCCKGLVCHLDDTCLPQNKGHTFHVALSWAIFLLIYSCEGLVFYLDHFPRQRSHFLCHTFLSKIHINVWLWRFCLSTGHGLSPPPLLVASASGTNTRGCGVVLAL